MMKMSQTTTVNWTQMSKTMASTQRKKEISIHRLSDNEIKTQLVSDRTISKRRLILTLSIALDKPIGFKE